MSESDETNVPFSGVAELIASATKSSGFSSPSIPSTLM
jgi:hypothetical protein